MYLRSGKRRHGFQAVNKFVSKTFRSNLLVIELLESRILLSGDPIYSYADPDGVTAWFDTAIAQPSLYNLGQEIAAIRAYFAGDNFFSSARITAETNTTKPYVDYLLDNLSYYQFNEWYDATTRIPYYVYNSIYVDEYFQRAVATPMWEFFPPYDGSLIFKNAGYYVEQYVQESLDSELSLWQDYTSDILPHSLPDIQVIEVESPLSANEGSVVSFSASIVNDSDCETGPFGCQYFLSSTVNPASIIYLEDPFVINDLYGGQSTADTRSLLLPHGVSGSYYVGLYANVSAAVPEDDTFNNFALAPSPLDIKAMPDFIASDIWATSSGSDEIISSAKFGDIILFHVAVGRTNLVEMPAADISIYASPDLTFNGNDILLERMPARQLFTSPDQLYANWHFAASPLNQLSPGIYHLIVYVDSDNQINEPNEDDNVFVANTLFTILNEIIPPSAPGEPVLSVDSGISSTDNITNDNTPTFGWAASTDNLNGSGIYGYQWRLDNGIWGNWQTIRNTTLAILADGEYVFYVRAKDNAGNIGPHAALTFTIDTIGPTVANASPLGELTENFDHLDISFNEQIDNNTFRTATDVQGNGPQGSFSGLAAQRQDTSYRIQFTEQEAGGDYSIVVGPHILDLAGNPMAQSFTGQFSLPVKVLVGTNAAKKVSYQDDDDGSLVTVQAAGGTASVVFDGTNLREVNEKKGVMITGNDIQIANIEFIAGGAATKLTVKAKGGNNQADLGGITGSFLGKLNTKGIDLVGDIDLSGGLGSMVVDDIFEGVTITADTGSFNGFNLKANHIGDDVVFDLGGKIKKFQAESYTGGAINADNIGQVKITKNGHFGADVKARSGNIQNVMAAGNITGDIMASGSIGKITSKGGSFTGAARAGTEIGTIQAINLQGAVISAGSEVGKVIIKGNFFDSYILGGYDTGSDCAFGLQQAGGGDIPGSGNVGSVIAKGKFARSYVCAGTLPHSPLSDAVMLDVALPYAASFGSIGKVKFGQVDFDAVVDFGLFAIDEIKPFKIGKSVAQSNGHFRVEVLS